MIDSREVLPDPDGPVRTTNSPGSRVSETSSSATTGPGCTRRTCSTTTRAPRAPVDSPLDTDLVVEVLLVVLRFDHDPELDPNPDRSPRPADRVPVAALESPRLVAFTPVGALLVVGARVAGRYDLSVVDELVGRLGVDRPSRSRPCGHLDPPCLARLRMVRRSLEMGDEGLRRGGRGEQESGAEGNGNDTSIQRGTSSDRSGAPMIWSGHM